MGNAESGSAFSWGLSSDRSNASLGAGWQLGTDVLRRILVHEDDGGSVKPEDVPVVKGASLRFDGAAGDVSFEEVKVSIGPAAFRPPSPPSISTSPPRAPCLACRILGLRICTARGF